MRLNSIRWASNSFFWLENTFASRSFWKNRNTSYVFKVVPRKFLNRKIPVHNFFSYLHRQLHQSGSFHVKRRSRQVQVLEVNKRILSELEDNPSWSTRSNARTTRVSRSIVLNISQEERLFPYHLQRTQALNDWMQLITLCE